MALLLADEQWQGDCSIWPKEKTQVKVITLFFAVFAASLIGGCAPIQMKKEMGALSLGYTPPDAQKSAQRTIAIVQPIFQGANRIDDGRFLSYGMTATDADIVLDFDRQYRERLATALRDSNLSLISALGFATMGPFRNFDEMTYPQKQSAFLASVPTLNFTIDNKIGNVSCTALVCTIEGTIQVSGEMLVRYVEPLTGQALLNKRIDLSEFSISKSYIKEGRRPPPPGETGVTMALANGISNAMGRKAMQDNSDRVLTEAINEFFAKAMKKVETFTSREELLAMERDVLKLKQIKRF